MVTGVELGVELGVGLSMALVTFVFNLHSNATWSLHSLWQFIPQSEKNVQRFTTGSSHGPTDVSLCTDLLCKCNLQIFACLL